MDTFFNLQQRLLQRISADRRYLYARIAWSERLIGILGARGVGKTTLLLQHIKEHYATSEKALYISIDHPYFEANLLYDFAEEFSRYGGELLCIDEVHKYNDWSSHLKAIYDNLPDLKVIFTGSSILRVARQKGDLSRRAAIYNLGGLSFREYLNLVQGFAHPPLAFEDILADHVSLAVSLTRDCKMLQLFREYLENGYYPFILEGKELYHLKLGEVLAHVLETDLPFAGAIATRQISKLKKLLYLLATSVPFVPDLTELARSTGISRPTIYEYLEKLQDAKVILLLRQTGRGYEKLAKPEKIYLENTNLMHTLSVIPDAGTARETFFANQIINAHAGRPALTPELLTVPKQGDFLVRGRWTFEVGGKSKTTKQIAGIPDSYALVDGQEIGHGRKIPLWLMGFLY